MNTSQRIQKTKRQFMITAAVTAVLVTAIVTFLVLLAYRTSWRYDMTGQKIFTLTEDTEVVLDNLSGEIRIAAVYPSGKENTIVMSLLDEYDKISDKISVEYIDAEKSPSKLASYHLGDVQAVYNGTLIVEGPERTRMIDSNDLFASGETGNLFFGEREITGAIRYVSSSDLPKVYFTQGHGELSTTNELTEAISFLQLGAYEVNTAVLLQTGIPEDAGILIMASPQKDIDESEKAMLSEFLGKGGSLLLMVDPVMNSNNVKLSNLNSIVNEYGIDISNNYVVEEDSAYYLSVSDMYLIPRYGAHEITQPIGNAQKLVILPVARGLGGVEYDEENGKRDILLLTSDLSWARADVTIEEENKTDRDIAGPIPLAFAATKGNGAQGQYSSRIVVIGDSTFATDGNISVQANSDLLVNSVNWLQGDREAEIISGKVINSDTMIVRGNDFIKLSVICCVVLPLIAFGSALALWYMRKNR